MSKSNLYFGLCRLVLWPVVHHAVIQAVLVPFLELYIYYFSGLVSVYSSKGKMSQPCSTHKLHAMVSTTSAILIWAEAKHVKALSLRKE